MAAPMNSSWRPFPPVIAGNDCTLCRGTGWQLAAEGGLATARRCPCARLRRSVKLKEHIRVPPRYEECTLSGYRPFTWAQSKALNEAIRFAERYPDAGRGLFFTGEPGVGKTHLAVGIVMELVRRLHEDILFLDFPALAEAPFVRVSSRLEGRGEVARMRLVSLLVLDNFGAAPITADILSLICQVLDARVRARRLTILTGEWVETGILMEGKTLDIPTQAHAFLAALPAPLLWSFLGTLKVIPVRGPDFRRRRAESSGLFPDVS